MKNNIEFVGLPGVGKTSIKNKFIIQNNNMRYNDGVFLPYYQDHLLIKIRKLFSFVFFLIRNINFTLNICKFTLNVKPINKQSMYRLFHLARLCQLLNDKQNKKVILDQGVIQLIWSIVISGKVLPKDKLLKNLINSIIKFLPNKIVFCEANTNTVLNRIQNRNTNLKSRLDNMDSKKRKRILLKNKNYLNKIVSFIATNPEVTVIKLNTEDDIDKNVCILTNTFMKI